MPTSLAACAFENPAFDDCQAEDCRAEGTGAEQGDGDGDTAESTAGDGDGDTGDSTTGDGDGDGDGLLPSCPDTQQVVFPLLQDTFLVAGPGEGTTCFVSWDYNQWIPNLGPTQTPCTHLDFGGAPLHSVCNEGECLSYWLGQFKLEGWQELAPSVKDAKLEFTAKVDGEGVQASVVVLDVDTSVFGNCATWQAGGDWGGQVTTCETSYHFAAEPTPWGSLIDELAYAPIAGVANVPGGELTDQSFGVLISNELAAGWLANPATHSGVLLRSTSGHMPRFAIHAHESDTPPKLVLQMCLN